MPEWVGRGLLLYDLGSITGYKGDLSLHVSDVGMGMRVEVIDVDAECN